jgi:hypothetical protein
MSAPEILPASRRAPVTIQNKAGDVIRTSQNLRGILRYAAEVSPVRKVWCCESRPFNSTVTQYRVEFEFYDGSTGFSIWADWRVLVDWIKARVSWRYMIAELSGELDWKNALADYMAKYRATA